MDTPGMENLLFGLGLRVSPPAIPPGLSPGGHPADRVCDTRVVYLRCQKRRRFIPSASLHVNNARLNNALRVAQP